MDWWTNMEDRKITNLCLYSWIFLTNEVSFQLNKWIMLRLIFMTILHGYWQKTRQDDYADNTNNFFKRILKHTDIRHLVWALETDLVTNVAIVVCLYSNLSYNLLLCRQTTWMNRQDPRPQYYYLAFRRHIPRDRGLSFAYLWWNPNTPTSPFTPVTRLNIPSPYFHYLSSLVLSIPTADAPVNNKL